MRFASIWAAARKSCRAKLTQPAAQHRRLDQAGQILEQRVERASIEHHRESDSSYSICMLAILSMPCLIYPKVAGTSWECWCSCWQRDCCCLAHTDAPHRNEVWVLSCDYLFAVVAFISLLCSTEWSPLAKEKFTEASVAILCSRESHKQRRLRRLSSGD